MIYDQLYRQSTSFYDRWDGAHRCQVIIRFTLLVLATCYIDMSIAIILLVIGELSFPFYRFAEYSELFVALVIQLPHPAPGRPFIVPT
jgi:hypothetical protein